MQAVKDVTQAWEDIRLSLRTAVGADRFERWLENLILVSMDTEAVTIGTPNRFVLEWIEARYLKDLKRMSR